VAFRLLFAPPFSLPKPLPQVGTGRHLPATVDHSVFSLCRISILDCYSLFFNFNFNSFFASLTSPDYHFDHSSSSFTRHLTQHQLLSNCQLRPDNSVLTPDISELGQPHTSSWPTPSNLTRSLAELSLIGGTAWSPNSSKSSSLHMAAYRRPTDRPLTGLVTSRLTHAARTAYC
jgi:hypothetical protein